MSEQMMVNIEHEQQVNTSTFPPDNYVIISGILDQPFSYSHTTANKDFYQSTISVKRQSGTVDNVPIIVYKDMLPKDDHAGIFIEVKGSVRSFTINGHTRIFVFSNYLHVCDNEEDLKEGTNVNHVYLTGMIHMLKGPRETFFGRTIADILLRINRNEHQFYIPCIAWGNTAVKIIAHKRVNDPLRIFGRFQSRVYYKYFAPDSTEGEFRTTNEISIISVKPI